MPSFTVVLMPSGKKVDVPAGTSLQLAAEHAGLPISSCCDGDFLCGFCVLEVIGGLGNLGPVETKESKVLAAMGSGGEHRLACQAKVNGPVTVRAPYW